MYAIAPADWTREQHELWRRIAQHAFERPDQPLDFTQRLARDRDWSLDFARGAVAEYRRFCFLAMSGPAPVTPSEEVDEVWHQHLIYTRDYWVLWCGYALGGDLHHDPTRGGDREDARYRVQYAETLARYEAYFGAPDPAYWPATHRRFGVRPRYHIVDRDRTIVLRWPGQWGAGHKATAVAFAALAGILNPDPALALALPANPYDWPAAPFLALYGTLVAGAVAFAFLARDRLRTAGFGAFTGPWAEAAAIDLGLLHLAWLGGGRQRAADLALAGLVDAGAARLATRRLRVGAMTLPEIEVDDRGVALPEPFAPFRGLVQGGVTHAAFTRAVAPALAPVEDDLVGRALVPARARIARTRLAIATVVGAVSAFGVIRIALGTLRDKPVGYLVVLTFATVIAAGFAAAMVPTRTRRGGAVLGAYRARYSRAASAPRANELLFAFAVGGAAVLTGTHLDDLGRLLKTPGGGGSDGGSGGDGSGCGGGCGGCGGGGGD